LLEVGGSEFAFRTCTGKPVQRSVQKLKYRKTLPNATRSRVGSKTSQSASSKVSSQQSHVVKRHQHQFCQSQFKNGRVYGPREKSCLVRILKALQTPSNFGSKDCGPGGGASAASAEESSRNLAIWGAGIGLLVCCQILQAREAYWPGVEKRRILT
jgi:hypothetical protein